MAEYDAFGRKIGEDPLADSGWRSGDPAAAPDVAPVVSAPPPDEPPPPAPPPPDLMPPRVMTPPRVIVRRGSGGVRGLVVLMIFLAVIGFVGSMVFQASEDAIDDLRNVIPSAAPPGAGGAEEGGGDATTRPAVPPQAPVGLRRGSLIRRAAFAQAMTELRTGDLGRITNLRVAPERIDVQLLTRDGRLRSVQFQPDGSMRRLSLSGPGFGHLRTIPYGAIDAAVPERVARRAAERLTTRTDEISYLVMLPFGSETVWSAFFKDGRYVQASADGRITRAVS